MRALLVLVAVLAAAGLAVVDRAGACSCIRTDPRERLREVDAAVVGTVVAGRDTARLRVEERIKGELPDEIELPNEAAGAACGAELRKGEYVGLFLSRTRDGRWATSLCDRAEPDELRRALRPLPQPAGNGVASLLGLGSYSGRRLTALDADGRVLAYGFGAGWSEVSVCPGSERIVERVSRRGTEALTLVVRRVRDMKVLGRRRAPRASVVALSCRDRLGRDLALLLSDGGEPTARGRLVSLRGRRLRTLRRGTIADATFAGRVAWLSEGRWGRDLVRFDLRTGAARRIARVPEIPGRWEVSPDGRRLATVAYGPELTEPSVTVVVDERGAVRTRPGGGSLVWVSRDSLLYDDGRLALLDARLRVVRRGGRGTAGDFVRAADGRVFGIAGRRLVEVQNRLRARTVAELPSDEIRGLVALPEGARIALPNIPPPTPSDRRVLSLARACARAL